MYVRPWDSDPQIGAVAYPVHEVASATPEDFYIHEYPEVLGQIRTNVRDFLSDRTGISGFESIQAYFGRGVGFDPETKSMTPPSEDYTENLAANFLVDEEGLSEVVLVYNEVIDVPDGGTGVYSETFRVDSKSRVTYRSTINQLGLDDSRVPWNHLERMPYHSPKKEGRHPSFSGHGFINLESRDGLIVGSFQADLVLEQGNMADQLFADRVIHHDVIDQKVDGALFVAGMLEKYADQVPRFVNGKWLAN